MRIDVGIAVTALAAVCLLAACGPHPRFANANSNSAETANTRPQRSQTERDIESMRTADFEFVYVFRRKDGAVLDEADRRYLNEQKPPEINRVKLTDEGRAVIFGSNFQLPEPQMEALKERFAFEDLSRPRPEQPPAANTNVGNQAK